MAGRILALVGAALTVMLMAGPAAAATPTIVRSDLAFSDHVDCGIFGDFDFTFDISLEGQETVQDFGDRLKIHQHWLGDVIASNGTTLRVNHAFTLTFDFTEGTLTITGVPFGTWVDGSSIRQLDRGIIVLDLGSGEVIFEAGEHEGPFDPALITCLLIAEAES